MSADNSPAERWATLRRSMRASSCRSVGEVSHGLKIGRQMRCFPAIKTSLAVGQLVRVESSLLQPHRQPLAKDDATRALLHAAIRDDPVCASLSNSDLETIVESMEYFVFEAGDVVVKEGDTGQFLFVTHSGKFSATVNGVAVNTLTPGRSFGCVALLYTCPRTATVVATEASSAWGGDGSTFRQVVQESAQRQYKENRMFLEAAGLFYGLDDKQRARVGELMPVKTVYKPGGRIVTMGRAPTAIFFVKSGQVAKMMGGQLGSDGRITGAQRLSLCQAGNTIGKLAVLDGLDASPFTFVALTECECLSISIEQLKNVLGEQLPKCLERGIVFEGLQHSPTAMHFTAAQKHAIVKAMELQEYGPDELIDNSIEVAIIIEGTLLVQYGDGPETTLGLSKVYETDNHARKPVRLKAGTAGVRMSTLASGGMSAVLTELGMRGTCTEDAIDRPRKLLMAKKVPIFQHLSGEQIERVVQSFELQHYTKGACVIEQGELGNSLYVIDRGEVEVILNGTRVIRSLGPMEFFGERALLLNELRSATVRIQSDEADIMRLDRNIFAHIVTTHVQEKLRHRMRLQDLSHEGSLKDFEHVRIIGVGGFGTVRLVKHRLTGLEFALKRQPLESGRRIPDFVQREITLLEELDHPFILQSVRTFMTQKSIYILTEFLSGGDMLEMERAYDERGEVLDRSTAQFYIGSLLLICEYLQDNDVVYRDLKPENVMFDSQGYVKLIDFGIAKKLEKDTRRTFTVVGTLFYMAPDIFSQHTGYSTDVDIWALGVLLYELVCGNYPFGGMLDNPDPHLIRNAVLHENLVFPKPYRDYVGKHLIRGMLRRDLDNRLGAGSRGCGELKDHDYFKLDKPGCLFHQIKHREFVAPRVSSGEQALDHQELEGATLSDMGEFCEV